MKKFVGLMMLLILLFGGFGIYYSLNRKVVSDNDGDYDSEMIYEKPTDPYGVDYLEEWQKELYNLFDNDSIKAGDTYKLGAERKIEDVMFVMDLFNRNNPNLVAIVLTIPETGMTADIKEKYSTGTTNNIYRHEVQLLKDEEKYYLPTEVINRANEIIDLIPVDATDYEKIKFIYDYLVQNVEYDALSSSISFYSYGALVNNKANAVGLAKSFDYLSKKVGVYSLYMYSWNVVWIDGKYYKIDVAQNIFLTNGNYSGYYFENIPLPNISREYINY